MPELLASRGEQTLDSERMAHSHPCPNDQGQRVIIHHPCVPSSPEAFADPGQLAVVVPEGQKPLRVNGIALEAWTSAPATLADWVQVAGQIDSDEPPLLPKPGKKLSAGAIVIEPDGRIWAVAPTNAFGGYQATFPKGTIDPNMTPQTTAIREVFEEAGLQIEITGWLGDFERTTSVTRYYFARRISGDPAKMGWESQAVMLVPKEKLFTVLHHAKDHELLTVMFAKLQALPTPINTLS
jgi:8-oxo-dGTP pyrophosphatase MutT (NUDIX family)